MQKIDFDGLALRLLDRARELLPVWLPGGKFRGHEFVCGDLAGEPGESLSVNVQSGKWADFATGEKGGDLISLYAAIHRLSQGDAAKALGADASLVPPTPARRAAPKRDEARSIGLPPADAPVPSFKSVKYGLPTAVWEYRTATGELIGYIARHDPKDSRKQILPYSWDSDGKRWRNWAFPTPRPLYGLHLLAQRPEAPVLIVEGEKAADAARELAKAYVVMTWPGGVESLDRADFSPLAGRQLLLWPDADNSHKYPQGHPRHNEIRDYWDQPGPAAMRKLAGRLSGHCPNIKIIDVADVPTDGWDAADAVAEGWDSGRFVNWAKPRAKAYQPAEVVDLDAKRREAKGEKPAKSLPASQYGVWEQLGLELSHHGSPVSNLSNVLRVFEGHPELEGIVYFDEFHQRYFHRDGREWTDVDELNLAAWIQRTVRFRSASSVLVHQAAMIYANRKVRNEPRDWMETLTWDGIERLAHFLPDAVGAADNDYTRAASRNFWVGMVARVYAPGCKVDTMLVLEGGQGIYKSSALKAIGGKWFAEAHESVNNSDFYLTLQGKLLIEIGELDAFNRADVNTIKKVVSCQTDRFRAPYARAAQDYPRRCVFVGTVNEDAYLRDATGGRRFWPIKCGEVRLDLIEDQREQLFAEAVAAFKAGESWWHMPGEATRREQELRRQPDEWEDIVHEWLKGKTEVRMKDVLKDALDIEVSRQDRNVQRRAAAVMKVLGWRREIVWEGQSVRVWRRIDALL